MGTHGGGLIRYKDQQFQFYQDEKGIESNIVEAIFRDSSDKLWVGTPDGLAYFADERFVQEGIPNVLRDVTIFKIKEDSSGTLWIATNGRGLISFQNGKTKVFNTSNGLRNDIINDISIDQNGEVWAATNDGLYLIKNDSVYRTYDTQNGLQHPSVMALHRCSRGKLWIGTKAGLAVFQHNSFETLQKPDVIDEHRVTDIMEDREGNIWVSTYRSGFYSLKLGKFTVIGEEEGLISSLVHGVTRLDNNRMIVATDEGINIITEDGEIFPYSNNSQLPDKKVRDVLVDRDGPLWISTIAGVMMDDLRGNIKTYTANDGLSNSYVRFTFQDKSGNFWFATPNGLNKLTESGFKNYTRDDGLSNEFVLSMYQTRDETIWIGTRDGLTRYKDNQFESFSVSDGLAGPVTFKMYEDNDGVLWIGANGGITRYYNGIFTPFTTEQGLYTNAAFSFLEDSSGYFWIPSNEGIYTISKNELNLVANQQLPTAISKIYNRNDGLRVNDCTANADPAVDSKGRFYIPTIKGVVIIDPYQVPKNEVPPLVVIQKVEVDGEKVSTNKPVIITPGSQRINIHFAGLSYQAPSRVQYEFKLLGFDKNFTLSKNLREVSYTNLEPGEYTFRVAASNNDGVWNREGASITIIKQAHFYQTIAFKILLIFSLLLLVYLLYLWRVRSVAIQNRNLERQVRARTIELEKQNEQIESQQEAIASANEQLKSKNSRLLQLNDEKNHLIKIVAHDLKSPLKQIMGLTNLLSMSQNIGQSEDMDYIERIQQSIKRLDHMISNILDIDSIESDRARINLTKIDITPLIEEVISVFEPLGYEKDIKIIFSRPDRPMVLHIDRTYFIQVIENLISNAIKFSPKQKQIFVRLNDDGENTHLEIEDQGPGLTAEDQKKLFGKFQLLSAKPTGGEISTGLGLSIVKKYVELMQGAVTCISEPGEGAIFRVSFATVSVDEPVS
jgi:signal transduction histidine kinase/ligand-binding sensor domain-containing protein